MDKNDPHIKLVDALTEVRRKLDAGDDDWRFALLTTFREFCRALGFEGYHTDPILKMMMEVQEEVLKHRRKQTGQKGRPPENRTLGMAIAAAAVTALSDSRRDPHMTVSDAITDMATMSGIPKAEIKTFRANVSRGKVGADVVELYRSTLQKFASWPKDEILLGVGPLSLLVT